MSALVPFEVRRRDLLELELEIAVSHCVVHCGAASTVNY